MLEKQSEGTTSSNVTLSTHFEIESALENRREEPPQHGQHQSLPGVQEMSRNQVDQQTEGHRQMDVVSVSLDNLEVVQDGHDVLRHEDIAGINSHAGH